MLSRHAIYSRLPEIAALMLVAIAALTVVATYVRQQQDYWVRHTLEAQNAIAAIETVVLDAQSGNRGYIITGDDGYLEPYTAAISSIGDKLAHLEETVGDNPEQIATLTAMKSIIAERLAILKEGVELRRTQGQEAAIDYVRTHNGSRLMKGIREHIATMKARESKLLADRRAEAARSDWYMSVLLGLGVLGALGASSAWISRSRRLMHELQASIIERETAEAQMRQMQKMEAIGQLTGGIAHDFNNMLAVIVSSMTLMKKRLAAGDTNVQKFVDSALEAAARATTLTKRLMAFSRQQPLSPQPLNANKLVSGMSDLIQRTIGEAVEVETVLAGGLWNTNVDHNQLENALLNLAVNARDAMPEGGKITIETENAQLDERYAHLHSIEPGQYVMIAITDGGSGMAPDVIARAFDPFFTTKPVGKGTGLGLSQVHGFVKQSGGHIKIYSEPGQGTTVKIYLPRFYGTQERAAEPAREEAARVTGNANVTILVVEDDEKVRHSTVQLLLELGYRVHEADGADAALRVLAEHPQIDVLFTDIVMPGLNGRKLADEALIRRPDLKVLFTTGFTRNAIVHHGVLDAGVQFIAKPFTLNELALKLQGIVVTIKQDARVQQH